ncbi:MAG: VanZ family protein [Lachnospirales bacterium]
MSRNKICIIISWALVILWCLLIFRFSSQVRETSNTLSTGITEIIKNFLESIAPNQVFDLENLNHIIRKMAHFCVYLGLGFLLLNAFYVSDMYSFKFILITLGLCVLYAISDEIHQMFVPGRGPQVKDVFIDSAGSLTGIAIYCFIVMLWNKFFDKKNII